MMMLLLLLLLSLLILLLIMIIRMHRGRAHLLAAAPKPSLHRRAAPLNPHTPCQKPFKTGQSAGSSYSARRSELTWLRVSSSFHFT